MIKIGGVSPLICPLFPVSSVLHLSPPSDPQTFTKEIKDKGGNNSGTDQLNDEAAAWPPSFDPQSSFVMSKHK